MYPAHSWSRDPLGQTILGGVLPTRGLTVQGLGQEAMGPQQVAQTPDLGHSGTTPLASKEEPDGTPPKKTSILASPGATHMVGGQTAPSLPFSPSGLGSPPIPAVTGSCEPTAGWQVEAWVRGKAQI